jgi:hypothetical protein
MAKFGAGAVKLVNSHVTPPVLSWALIFSSTTSGAETANIEGTIDDPILFGGLPGQQ